MKYILRNRNSDKDICIQSNSFLNFFYGNFFGRVLLRIFISKFFSNLLAFYMNSKLSKKRINKFIKKNELDMDDYEEKEYTSFNDFFIRKIKENKRIINKNKDIFISPCDSALTVYNIKENLTVLIKNSYYSISTLVNNDIMNEYKDGYMLVFRLQENNYHRYCYIDNGTHKDNIHIKGIYHTVQPISLNKYNFYKTNTREYTILNTENFDNAIQVEVGALGIGRIKNIHNNYTFKKGEEKGYFEFGGSTIVILVKKNIIEIDKDILNNSKDNIETIVKYGERIGIKK